MDQAQHNRLVSFIWGIADDVLRDVYQRGKYRDCILPMVVIRRLDVVLGLTKAAVLAMQRQLDDAGVANQAAKLREVSGQAFYNASPFRLEDIKRRDNPQRLKADFERYLDGFSPNVQQILKHFKFRNQIPTLVEAGILGALIEKFLDPDINLSAAPVLDADGRERLPALDNHGMSTVFEELLRRFNEENNEEAGEHFTPRDVVGLMSELIFTPIAERIESSTYLVLDDACGTGGMLTVAEDRLLELARAQGREVSIRLYGQEVNPETYAITTADLLLKGEGEQADQIVLGSTLSNDAFRGRRFDFMLANPPYGKSWKTDLERLGGKTDLKDPRFIIDHAGEADYSLVTRSSDGQLMFLANKLAKMVDDTPLGSRIAEVHNGSSLFTGDAGSGESNIRRWAIENDWLEAIVALPLSLFYNTGIATYIWVLSNRKAEHRRGRVQLIDATGWSRSLRKNLGKKGCELGPEDIARVIDSYQAFTDGPQSKIFPNRAFGYWKVRVERPLRLRSQFTRAAVEALRFASGDETWRRTLYARFGVELYDDWLRVRDPMETALIGETADSADPDEDTEPDASARRPAVPEPRRKRLLDPKTWVGTGTCCIPCGPSTRPWATTFTPTTITFGTVWTRPSTGSASSSPLPTRSASSRPSVGATPRPRRSSRPSTSRAGRSPTCCTDAMKSRPAPPVRSSSNTSRTRICATPSRCPFWKRPRRATGPSAASRPSSSAKSCPTARTPGWMAPRPASAMRSVSPAIFISRSRCGAWRRSGRISRRRSGGRWGCWQTS